MNPNAGQALLERIETMIIDPVIAVIFSLGLLLFFVGIVEFLWDLKGGKPSDTGKQHMMWGMVGMLIMVSVYGIINLIINTFELEDAFDSSRSQNIDTGINFFGN